jgi:hypothetical protein
VSVDLESAPYNNPKRNRAGQPQFTHEQRIAREHDVIRMRMTGMTYAQIGQKLGVTTGRVGPIFARGKRRLLQSVVWWKKVELASLLRESTRSELGVDNLRAYVREVMSPSQSFYNSWHAQICFQGTEICLPHNIFGSSESEVVSKAEIFVKRWNRIVVETE